MAAHVLVLPYPSQGHINPMLQFAKRLASKGPSTTLATTLFILESINAHTAPVLFAPISDGYDRGGVDKADSLEAYFASLESVGARTLEELIIRQRDSSSPFTCIVYDTYVPWAVPVARRLGLPAAAFSTQSCAVSSVYYLVNEGMLDLPEKAKSVAMFGLPEMERKEFPSFALMDGSYPTLARMALNQFCLPKKTDWVLFNSFDDIESKVMTCLKGHWRARAIGPTVPSHYIDKRIAGYDSYTMNLLKPEREVCLRWLDTKPACSVVYVSFGSFATLSPLQTEELALGLAQISKHFLWVVRATEQHKLPGGCPPDTGLVVSWSPQLEVLAHPAVGCFVTHCGWNSTLEALGLGVPMVAVPQWTDQPLNAKYVEDVWGIGVRARVGERGIVRRAEIERCVREVMEGEKSKEMRENGRRWRDKVKKALGEGGSSDENLNEFVEYLNGNAVVKEDSCRVV